jgi:hypothetical protein
MVLASVQLVFVGFVIMDLRSSKPVFTYDDELSLHSLHGLQGVEVVVVLPNQEVKGHPLYPGLLLSDVEHRLRKAGIEVLSRKQRQIQTGRACLYVHINIHTYIFFPFYVYQNRVEIEQDVDLVRASKIRTRAVTWSVSAAGLTSELGELEKAVGDLVDSFTEAYLSVNKK